MSKIKSYCSLRWLGLIIAIFIFSCNEKDSIADVPCEILDIHDDGSVTVYPYVKDGVIVREKYRGFIKGIGRLENREAKMQQEFLESKVELHYLTVGMNQDGSLTILALLKNANTEINLATELRKIIF
jgi:hypothetical protein